MSAPEPGWTRACTNSGNCIEARADHGTILLRNTHDPAHVLVTTREEFTAFLTAAKNGDLDHLVKDPHVNAYFGEDWHVPATEGEPRVPTPTGTPCIWCQIPSKTATRGFMYSWARKRDDGQYDLTQVPYHRECQLRSVLGSPAHLDGNCTCHGGDPTPQTPAEIRAEAIEVWNRVTSGRM